MLVRYFDPQKHITNSGVAVTAELTAVLSSGRKGSLAAAMDFATAFEYANKYGEIPGSHLSYSEVKKVAKKGVMLYCRSKAGFYLYVTRPLNLPTPEIRMLHITDVTKPDDERMNTVAKRHHAMQVGK